MDLPATECGTGDVPHYMMAPTINKNLYASKQVLANQYNHHHKDLVHLDVQLCLAYSPHLKTPWKRVGETLAHSSLTNHSSRLRMLKLEAPVSTKGNVRCVAIIFAFAIYWWVDYFLPFLSIETFIGIGKKKGFQKQLKLQPQQINTPTMFGSIVFSVFSRFSNAAKVRDNVSMQKSSIESNKKKSHCHIYLYRRKLFYWGLANGCSGHWVSLQLNVPAFLRCCGGICFLLCQPGV